MNSRRKYEPDQSCPKSIIVDLNATLVKTTAEDITSSFDITKIEPRRVVIDMIQSWVSARNYKVLYISGTDSNHLIHVIQWISKHASVRNMGLYMSDTIDGKDDKTIKEEIFWKHLAHNFNVVAAIDNVPESVQMWKNIGIETVFGIQ